MLAMLIISYRLMSLPPATAKRFIEDAARHFSMRSPPGAAGCRHDSVSRFELFRRARLRARYRLGASFSGILHFISSSISAQPDADCRRSTSLCYYIATFDGSARSFHYDISSLAAARCRALFQATCAGRSRAIYDTARRRFQ